MRRLFRPIASAGSARFPGRRSPCQRFPITSPQLHALAQIPRRQAEPASDRRLNPRLYHSSSDPTGAEPSPGNPSAGDGPDWEPASCEDGVIQGIDKTLSSSPLKEGTSWGFVVYRVSYGNDEAWRRMRHLIETEVTDALEKAYVRRDLLARHQLVVMDDASKFDGAGHREVRRHFWSWAAEEFSRNLTREWPLSDDEWADVRDQDRGKEGLESIAGARYTHCLMVDDICLESLDHLHWPVIKVVRKHWWPCYPENEPIHPDWEDGVMDDETECVGWMYADVCLYVSTFGALCEPDTWHDIYIRPPEMDSQTDRNRLPGFWRRK